MTEHRWTERWSRGARGPLWIAAVAALLLGGADRALACSCVPASTMAMADRSSDIFVARAISGPEITSDRAIPDPEAGKRQMVLAGGMDSSTAQFTLEVTESLKGHARGRVAIETPSNPAACGEIFHLGETYLIFAHRGAHGQLETDICMQNVSGDTVPAAVERVRKVLTP